MQRLLQMPKPKWMTHHSLKTPIKLKKLCPVFQMRYAAYQGCELLVRVVLCVCRLVCLLTPSRPTLQVRNAGELARQHMPRKLATLQLLLQRWHFLISP